MTPKQKKQKAERLTEIYGESLDGMVHRSVMDSVVPCICTNEDCDNTDELEPDCRTGYCHTCGGQTMASILVLMDMI